MNPLLKTPPGRSSKCSCSIACSMRALIFVTLETSSSESSFFSRALRNFSPNSPMVFGPDAGNIIGQADHGGYCQQSKRQVTKVAGLVGWHASRLLLHSSGRAE